MPSRDPLNVAAVIKEKKNGMENVDKGIFFFPHRFLSQGCPPLISDVMVSLARYHTV